MEWAKALHVISIIAWMAGLLYLPRLFVYHAGAEPGSERSEIFKVMERRLYRAIMMPAMISSWFFGLALVFYFQTISFEWGWVWLKAASVVAMTVIHFWLGRQVQVYGSDQRPHSSRFFRFVNEVPTVLMIVIVISVIVRPF